jgi:hypothetical protein
MGATESYYSSGEYWRRRLSESSDFKVRLVLRALADAKIELRSSFRGIEIGCGNGAFLFPLAKALDATIGTFSLRGVDIATNAIEAAKLKADSIGETRVCFSPGSASDVDSQFDVVFLMDVVEHVTDPYSFLGSLRTLAPLVVMHIPIEQSLAHGILSKPQQSYNAFHHVHFFSLETMRLLVKEAGFEIEAMQFTSASPEVLRFQGSLAVRASRLIRYCAYKVAPGLSSLLMGGSVMVIMRPALQGRLIERALKPLIDDTSPPTGPHPVAPEPVAPASL